MMFAGKNPTPLIYVYRPNGDPDFFNVETLKTGLSKALVPFYPLAGLLVKDQDGRLEVDCGYQGVLLVVARSDSTIGNFGEFLPSPELCRMLTPSIPSEDLDILFMTQGVLLVVAQSDSAIDNFGEFLPSPKLCRMLTPSIPSEDPDILFMTQVTFFKGGEVILSTSWRHVIGDGMSAMNFILTWPRMTLGVTNLGIHPLHNRTLLQARSPPKVLFDHVGKQLPCAETTTGPSATSILLLTKSQLALLTMNKKISTFCAISAHVWKCVCIARGLARDQAVRLLFPVNVQRRINPPLPDDYFGNALCRMAAIATVDDVLSNPIEVVANKIRDDIRKVNDEYVRSFIDHLDQMSTRQNVSTLTEGNTSANPERIAPRSEINSWFYFSLTPTMADFATVSWVGMPIYDADFGWGKLEIISRAAMTSGQRACIMESPKGDEVLVQVLLEEENMERFKEGFYEGLNMHGTIKTD